MSEMKQEYKDLGSSIKSIIQFIEEEPGVDTLEMRMKNRRIIISRIPTETDKGISDFYKIIFQRAVPKEDIQTIEKQLEEDLIGAKLVRRKVLMTEIILSREAYEALIVGFFKLESPNMNMNMKVIISEHDGK